MEYLRRGQSQVDYITTLETVITRLDEKSETLKASPETDLKRLSYKERRMAGIGKHIDRFLTELATIEDSQEAGFFLLPDGQQIPDVTFNYMQVLSLLPISPKTAISTRELTLKNYANELGKQELTFDSARASTLASISALRRKLGNYGWTVENAAPEFVVDEITGKKHKAEAKYCLKKVPQREVDNNLVDGTDDSQIEEEIFKEEVFTFIERSREAYRKHALNRISKYLQTPGEKVLRTHQLDVFDALYRYFSSGETSGTIVLPTGAGKTYVAAELMRVLGIPAIIFSPTIDILGQNNETISNVCEEMTVTNFYGQEKMTSGDIINTLYQSFPALTRQTDVDLGRFGLVIYDEADLSLGEERHKMHAKFPNAIKIALTATPDFERINEYEDQGLIDERAEWLDTFRNIIHEMSIEEAFLRGAVPHLDMHLVRTKTVVRNLVLAGEGNYNQSQLNREINIRSRNALVLAMIAGLNAATDQLGIANDQKEEIAKIHEKIKGKRTLIHGINIPHILLLEKALQELGISAKAIYGAMKGSRREVINKVKTGEIQVLIGDEITGRGLDIPELEVSIHMEPTLSARKLIQQVGRLFRHSPKTGKEKGIAIQLVDTYVTDRSRQPILLPAIFDTQFILQSRKSSEPVQPEDRKSERKGRREKLPTQGISIEGSIDLDAYFEEIMIQDLLQSRFKNASLEEVNTYISSIFNEIVAKQSADISLFELYSELSQRLPIRVSSIINQKAVDVLTSDDIKESSVGKQVLIGINLKSILAILRQYLGADLDRNNDLVASVLSEISNSADLLRGRHAVTINLHRLSHQYARKFLATEYEVPINWVAKGVYLSLIKEVDRLFSFSFKGVSSMKSGESFVSELASRFSVSERSVKAYIEQRNSSLINLPEDVGFDDPTYQQTFANLRVGYIGDILVTLTTRERRVIDARFNDGLSLEDIGKEFGATRVRIGQLLANALKKLRHPVWSRKLKELV